MWCNSMDDRRWLRFLEREPDGSFRYRIDVAKVAAQFYFGRECHLPSAEPRLRENYLLNLIFLSSTQRWAWDTLMRIVEQTIDFGEPLPQPLARFAAEVAIGRRRFKRGNPGIDTGEALFLTHLRDELVKSGDLKAGRADDLIGEFLGMRDPESARKKLARYRGVVQKTFRDPMQKTTREADK